MNNDQHESAVVIELIPDLRTRIKFLEHQLASTAMDFLGELSKLTDEFTSPLRR